MDGEVRWAKGLAVFAGALVVTLIVQLPLWRTSPYVDSVLWEPAVDSLTHSGLPPLGAEFNTYPVPLLLYPGDPIIFLASALERDGRDASTALRLAMPLLLSFFVALLALLTYVLEPRRPVWAAVVALAGINRLYLNATPGSALALLLIPLITLTVLALYERRHERVLYPFLGVIGGVALSTRFDISAVYLAVALLILATRSWKRAAAALVVMLGVFALLDPYLRTAPIEHLSAILGVAHRLYSTQGAYVFFLPSLGVIRALFLGAIGLVVAAATLFSKEGTVLPRAFVLWFGGLTLVILAGLLLSKYHPDWYFYVPLMVWMLLLPLLLIRLIEKARPNARFLSYSVLLLLVVAQSIIFLQGNLGATY